MLDDEELLHEDGEVAGETVGTTSSPLCTDDGPNATIAYDRNPGTWSTVTSLYPSNAYDHPDCSDRFTVEVTGVDAAYQAFTVHGSWGQSLPTNEEACKLAFANVQTHEYVRTIKCGGGGFCWYTYEWQPVGDEVLLKGVWAKYWNREECWLEPTGASLPTLEPSSTRKKVRVAVRAYGWALFFPSYKRAIAGVHTWEIIR
jgi:hypothetical protein